LGILESHFAEIIRPMNPSSISRTEGTAGAAARDQADLQETRLWDRARSTLLLLYGGRRGGGGTGQGVPNNGGNSFFGNIDLEI